MMYFSTIVFMVIFLPFLLFASVVYFFKERKWQYKIISALMFLLLCNLPPTNFLVHDYGKEDGVYDFQTCNGEYKDFTTIIDDCFEDCIVYNFNNWKLERIERKDLVLYRSFERKWWKFWLWRTYIFNSVYNIPLLPSTCKIMRYDGK
jgi:hypothetical protein